jgi:serine/threonine protein kinase
MHSLNIVHLDIKPQNIVYSNIYKKLVFIDFGMSECKYINFGKKQA